jgi:cytochrome c-type biogenesis protein CcmH
MKGWILVALFVLFSSATQARVEVYQFDSPKQEADYKHLTEVLRCLVCQNQNLADSNAELAQDLRQKTYEMVVAGNSKQAVVDYMVQRYGDFVLYSPPLKAITLLLWIGPFLLFFGGTAVLIMVIRRQRKPGATDEVDNDDLRAVQQLLEKEQDKPS